MLSNNAGSSTAVTKVERCGIHCGCMNDRCCCVLICVPKQGYLFAKTTTCLLVYLFTTLLALFAVVATTPMHHN